MMDLMVDMRELDEDEGKTKDKTSISDDLVGRQEQIREVIASTKPSARAAAAKRKPMIPVRKRQSRSTSPVKRSAAGAGSVSHIPHPTLQHSSHSSMQAGLLSGQHHGSGQHLIRIQPAIPPNANIRHIMENITKTEGPFENPEDALKEAISALSQETW